MGLRWHLCLVACLLLVTLSKIEAGRLRRQAEREDDVNNEVNPGDSSNQSPPDQTPEKDDGAGPGNDSDDDGGDGDDDDDDGGFGWRPDFVFRDSWNPFEGFVEQMHRWREEFTRRMQQVMKQLHDQLRGMNGTALSCQDGEGNTTSKIVEQGGRKYNVTTTICEKESGGNTVYAQVTSINPAKRKKRHAIAH